MDKDTAALFLCLFAHPLLAEASRLGFRALFCAIWKEVIIEIHNKSEPISHRENAVRIILVWCGWNYRTCTNPDKSMGYRLLSG